ncbi:MAG: AI-2E family transporter [Firmicutes bacterium]|nr:AI-2E family transporter [Bacillota bacterium]
MKFEWKTGFKFGGTIFLLYLCIHYWTKLVEVFNTVILAAQPLLIGCIIAYAINILMSVYERNYFPKNKKAWMEKSRRPVCLIAAVISLIGIVVLVVWMVLPQLIQCIQLIIQLLPGAIANLIDKLDEFDFVAQEIIVFLESIDWESKINQIVEMVTSSLGDMVSILMTTITSVFSIIVTVFLSVIFSVYLLTNKDNIKRQAQKVMLHYFPGKWCEKITYVLYVVNDCFRRYVVGQCTEAVILGCLCILGMTILRMPYAAMIGALVAVTALVPVAGAFIGAGVGAFMILTVSPMKALIFLIFFVVLQQLEGNLIYPRVVGSSLGLPGIWVLAAVTIGGGIWGITGMLLGVPLTAAVWRIVREDMNKEKRWKKRERLQREEAERQALEERMMEDLFNGHEPEVEDEEAEETAE